MALASVALSCGAVAGLSLVTPQVDALELKGYDVLMTVWRGPRPPSGDVVIVAIDESSIREFSGAFTWPWPRSVHGALIGRLSDAGAAAIVFDVVFDLPSSPDEDAELAGAIRQSRAPVVLAAAVDVVTDREFQLTQEVRPLDAFIEAGARVGFASLAPDVDGVIRRAPREVRGGAPLAVAAAEAGGRRVDEGGEYLIDYVGPSRAIRTVSYYQVVTDGALPPGTFAGKTVFVGRSLTANDLAAGARQDDLFPTPFDPLMPGVEIHANALETLTGGRVLRRSPSSVTWIMMLAVAGAIAGAMLWGRSLRRKLMVAGALVPVPFVVAVVAFLWAGWWVYSVQPVLVALATFGANALYQYRESDRERAFVRKALTGYVSKPVLQRLLANPEALELGGVQVHATVLFADIAGFSSISERMTPRDLTALLNEYFTRIGDAVMAEEGMIDKYIGDAIMAVWGAPLADERHASRACAAALSIQRAIDAAGGPLRSRTGINTGTMMAGNLGHRERMEYTVIGDSVNLASRLEGANKVYGTSILVSESTWREASADFVFRRVDRLRVVGKQEPAAVYELLAARDGSAASAQASARAASFERVLAAYDRRDWAGATEELRRHTGEFAADRLAAVYESRCRAYALHPPPDGWDGVSDLQAK